MFSLCTQPPSYFRGDTKGHHLEDLEGKVVPMQEVIHGPKLPCPFCRCAEVYRTRSKGIIERHLFRVLHLCPYRCTLCDRRFYAGAVSRGAYHGEAVMG
jgi:hypothetical protein